MNKQELLITELTGDTDADWQALHVYLSLSTTAKEN